MLHVVQGDRDEEKKGEGVHSGRLFVTVALQSSCVFKSSTIINTFSFNISMKFTDLK
jgi:hypothetical protein